MTALYLIHLIPIMLGSPIALADKYDISNGGRLLLITSVGVYGSSSGVDHQALNTTMEIVASTYQGIVCIWQYRA